MFEAAVDVVAQMQQEEVFGKRGGVGEHGELGFADALHVAAEAVAVEVGVVSAECDAVGDAVRFKGEGFDAAEFDGVVDEFAV